MATANKILLVPIELDKMRNLRLDFNALSRAERINKKNYLNGDDWKNISVSELTALIWCGLIHEDSNLKMEVVGAEIHQGNLAYVSECLMLAQGNAMPEATEEEAPDPLPSNVSRLRGTNSGPSGASTSD